MLTTGDGHTPVVLCYVLSRALARPASVSVLGRTRPPSGVSLKPSATSDALPALHGRPRAASAAIRSTGSTSDAALTAKTSSLSFESVLRLYFRLATEEDLVVDGAVGDADDGSSGSNGDDGVRRLVQFSVMLDRHPEFKL